MKPTTLLKSRSSLASEDPWKRLLTAARQQTPAVQGHDHAPEDFTPRVVAAWMRSVAPQVISVTGLWEMLGLRAAIVACAAVLIGLCLNVGVLRDELSPDDSDSDPVATLSGFTLQGL